MSKIIYPEKMVANSNIGVTAMSMGAYDEYGVFKLERGIENFKDRGFNVVETSNVRLGEKFVSSVADVRASEFMSLWEREDIPYIIVFRGGEFLMETLPFLHEQKDKIAISKPKWVQGYSDVSLLNFYLTTNYNFATIHTNTFGDYCMKPWDKTLELAVEVVQSKEDFAQLSFEKYCGAKGERTIENACNPYVFKEQVVYKSLFGAQDEGVEFSGRLIGGCMDVIKILCGTEFDNTKNFCKQFDEGMLWYLENCELSVLEMKRVLWQMKLSGWFENANGFIIGRTVSNEMIGDFSYEDALIDVLKDLNVPVIYDVDFGHTDPQWTIINGAFGEFKYSDGKGEIKQFMK